MLPSIVRKFLETKLYREIRYPYDVELLCYDIEKHVHRRISVNTLKRLPGFIEGVKEHRLYTLDIIAVYLDFKNWDELTLHLDNVGNSAFNSIKEIEMNSLNPGDKISFTYAPGREVIIEYLEKDISIVTKSRYSKLKENVIRMRVR